ncbi:preprotein translocase subunit SecG [Bacillus licheniformis]|nr:preprotein translocase subunit SecG [Bacillus licheniformis]
MTCACFHVNKLLSASLSGGVGYGRILTVLLVIVSIVLIVVVYCNPAKRRIIRRDFRRSRAAFGKQKARGLDLILHRMTVVLTVLFFFLTIALAYFV